jgi:hypothetical protein
MGFEFTYIHMLVYIFPRPYLGKMASLVLYLFAIHADKKLQQTFLESTPDLIQHPYKLY